MNASTPSQIQSQINALQHERQQLDLRPLALMASDVNEQLLKATLHPDSKDARGMLEQAVNARRQVEQNHERAKEIDVLLGRLDQQKQINADEERRHQREEAQQLFENQVADFKRRAIDVTRSYRELLNICRQQGRDTTLLPSFTFSHLAHDPNSTFLLSQEMQMGILRFEPQPETPPADKALEYWQRRKAAA